MKIYVDIISREKYKGTKITFRSISDLHKYLQPPQDLSDPGSLSTLQLIKNYIENNKSKKGFKQVRYFSS